MKTLDFLMSNLASLELYWKFVFCFFKCKHIIGSGLKYQPYAMLSICLCWALRTGLIFVFPYINYELD